MAIEPKKYNTNFHTLFTIKTEQTNIGKIFRIKLKFKSLIIYLIKRIFNFLKNLIQLFSYIIKIGLKTNKSKL